jgi:hypothetical protein
VSRPYNDSGAWQHSSLAEVTDLSPGGDQAMPVQIAVPERQPALGNAPAPASSFGGTRLMRSRWPLLAVLVVQAALSMRLVWSITAFRDEALYLWVGHMEWSHWLYGARLPHNFPALFSGAPVVYPPFGAIADTYGGLAGARCLSLLLMLMATVLLHGVTRRIFDRRAAWMAAALFAGLGSVQYLGAFATYDAMALFMLALATWIGVRAAATRPAVGFPMLVLASVALVLADAAKYVATMFDPVVVMVIAAAFWRAHGRRAGAAAGGLLAVLLAADVTGGLAWGGHAYWLGIERSTLARPPGPWPIFGILYVSTGWVGALVLLAIIGAVAATWTSEAWATKVMVWALAGGGCLAPVEQARIHVFTSLFKHIGYGGWFAASVAGFALTAFMKAVPAVKQPGALRTCLVTIGLTGILGAMLAGNQFSVWPSVDPILSTLQRVTAKNPGLLLAEDAPSFAYYLSREEPWQNIVAVPAWAGLANTGAEDFPTGVQQHKYAVIALTFDGRGGACVVSKGGKSVCNHTIDGSILRAIRAYGGYKLVAKIPYRTSAFRSVYMVWVREK